MSGVRRRLTVLACAPLLLVTACAGDGAGEWDVPPDGMASQRATEPGTPDRLPLPAAADKKTRAGARAFLEHWTELGRHAAVTGEVGPMSALRVNTCEACHRADAWITSIYRDKGKIKSGEWVLREVGPLKRAGKKQRYRITAALRSPKMRVLRADGSVREFAARTQHLEFRLVWTSQGWSIAEWGAAPVS